MALCFEYLPNRTLPSNTALNSTEEGSVGDGQGQDYASAGPDGGTLINGRFRPTKKLGSGSFGEIYMGVGANGEKVAIKFEKAGLRCPQLRHEYKAN